MDSSYKYHQTLYLGTYSNINGKCVPPGITQTLITILAIGYIFQVNYLFGFLYIFDNLKLYSLPKIDYDGVIRTILDYAD